MLVNVLFAYGCECVYVCMCVSMCAAVCGNMFSHFKLTYLNKLKCANVALVAFVGTRPDPFFGMSVNMQAFVGVVLNTHTHIQCMCLQAMQIYAVACMGE